MSNLLDRWVLIRKQLADLQLEHDLLKEKIHELMNDKEVNKIATDRYLATRTFQTKETIKRATVPEDIWNRYATTVEFPVLRVKKK
jgi:hypothetical protein